MVAEVERADTDRFVLTLHTPDDREITVEGKDYRDVMDQAGCESMRLLSGDQFLPQSSACGTAVTRHFLLQKQRDMSLYGLCELLKSVFASQGFDSTSLSLCQRDYDTLSLSSSTGSGFTSIGNKATGKMVKVAVSYAIPAGHIELCSEEMGF